MTLNTKSYVLIVDDDKDIREMLGIFLKNEGIPFLKCENGLVALDYLEKYKINLVLLDIMMPEIDGLEVCIKIRQVSTVPIIFMSAKNQDIDKVNGLMIGADDYITKPFNPVELLARIKAQIRRYVQYSLSEHVNCYFYKNLEVNSATRQAWVSGEELRLTPKEYSILELFIQHKGMVLSFKQIYETVWHEIYIDNQRTILMHISNLREKIKKIDPEIDYIKTVWGLGYKL